MVPLPPCTRCHVCAGRLFLQTQYADLPADVVEATKTQILDTVAVALPALHEDGIHQLYAMAKASGGKEKAWFWAPMFACPQSKQRA